MLRCLFNQCNFRATRREKDRQLKAVSCGKRAIESGRGSACFDILGHGAKCNKGLFVKEGAFLSLEGEGLGGCERLGGGGGEMEGFLKGVWRDGRGGGR